MKNKFIILFIIFILTILILPYFAPFNPLSTNSDFTCKLPNFKFLLGTDEIGRDIFSRILFGARTTIIIGLLSAIFACLIGSFLGLISGFFGGIIDLIISYIIDIALAFPSLLLAIGISIVLPQGLLSTILSISLTSWAGIARVIKNETSIIKNFDYVLSARALGTSKFKIILKHILPNCMPLIIISTTLQLGTLMLAESGLSFLGLGIPAPYPTLGGMISSGRDCLLLYPWIPILPGIIIALIVLLSNVFGELIQNMLNPRN